MSEEQLKAAETETETAQVEDGVEEISEEDLAGVAGGGGYTLPELLVGIALVGIADTIGTDIYKKSKS